jgi:hypothetical protein
LAQPKTRFRLAGNLKFEVRGGFDSVRFFPIRPDWRQGKKNGKKRK